MKKPVIPILLLSVFIALLGVGIIAPIMPVYAIELGATGLTLGLMVASFSVTRSLMQPLVGTMSDRTGRKRFLITGLCVYSVSAVAYSFADSVGHLILIRLFHGAGSAMTIPMAMAYIADCSPEGQEGRYMGLLNIAIFAGMGGGPLLGGLFRDLWGMDAAFYAMALLSLSAMVLVLLLLPAAGSEPKRQDKLGLFRVLKLMLTSRKIVGVLLSRMATMTIMIPTFGFLPIMMTRDLGSTGLEIGIVVATRTLVNAVLQTPFGRLADRWNKVALVATGSFAVAVLMVLIPFARSFAQLVVLFVVVGSAEALIWPALGAFAVEEGRRYGQGSMMGVFNMAMSFGILLGSLVGGAFMDLLGLRFSFFSIAAFLAMCTIAACRLIVSAQSQSTKPAPPD
jgi:MFS family permease